MKKILLLEDDLKLGTILCFTIRNLGFQVTRISKISEARQLILSTTFDLLIFDVMPVDGNSIDFCREIRLKKILTPLIFISAISREEVVVEALNAGANDYIRKPFGMSELSARLLIQLNLLTLRKTQNESLEYKGLIIKKNERSATFNGRSLNMNKIKLDILYYLTINRNSVITRDNLLNYIKRENDVFDRTIDAHISQMRKNFRNLNIEEIKINSIYGAGYKIEFAQ